MTPTDEVAKVPATTHEEHGENAQRAAEEEARRQAQFDRDAREADRVAQQKLREAEALAQKRAEESRLAQERAAAEHDRKLIEELKARLKKEEEISLALAEQAKNKEIREKLMAASIVKDAGNELEREKEKAGLNLAQLLQMAAITMQAATAMNSMEGTSPSPSTQTFDPTQPVAPKAALAGRSPASLGDKKNTISQKSDDPELANGEQSKDEKSIKDKETLAKIKAEVEAAEKRKKIYGMRLKKKLRDRLNAQNKGAGSVDTDELFGGSLHQGMESADANDQTEESAAKDSALAAPSIYQAVREGFSLAGTETDREVGDIVAEAQRDLSSEDMSAGVLGRESPSLFVRVHAVHQACQRDKCVLAR